MREFELRFPAGDYALGIDFERKTFVISQVENRDEISLFSEQAAQVLLSLSPDELDLLLTGVSARQKHDFEQVIARVHQRARASAAAPNESGKEVESNLREIMQQFTLDGEGDLERMIASLHEDLPARQVAKILGADTLAADLKA